MSCAGDPSAFIATFLILLAIGKQPDASSLQGRSMPVTLLRGTGCACPNPFACCCSFPSFHHLCLEFLQTPLSVGLLELLYQYVWIASLGHYGQQ